jgi:hypothetical protein
MSYNRKRGAASIIDAAQSHGPGFGKAKIQTSMTIRMMTPPNTILLWIFRSPLLT